MALKPGDRVEVGIGNTDELGYHSATFVGWHDSAGPAGSAPAKVQYDGVFVNERHELVQGGASEPLVERVCLSKLRREG